MTEREWDRRLHIRSMGREDEDGATYLPYEPTPYAVLERVAESGYIRRRDRLLDYGCGKGRVAFFMAHAVGCAAVGIDHAQRLIDLAREKGVLEFRSFGDEETENAALEKIMRASASKREKALKL